MEERAMDCQSARTYVHAFLDDELDVERNLEVLRHVNCCRRCADIVESERAFREAVEDRLEDEPVPGGLEERVLARVRAADAGTSADRPGPEREGRRAPGRWFTPRRIRRAVAAAILFSLLFVVPFPTPGPTFERVALAAADAHEHERPSDYSGTLAEIRERMGERFAFEVCVPDLSSRNICIEGGSVVRFEIGETEGAVLRYACPDGSAVSHIDVPVEEVDLEGESVRRVERGGIPFLVLGTEGCEVVAVRRGGVLCMFVGEQPTDRLIDLFLARVDEDRDAPSGSGAIR